ncbi:hypothetical protein EYD10_17521, partial [Varanus komodoensis]
MSSELETTSFFDSDDDDSTSRFSSSTEQSSASRLMRRHKRRRRKQKVPRIERILGLGPCPDGIVDGRDPVEDLVASPSSQLLDPEVHGHSWALVDSPALSRFLLLQSSSFSSITDSTMSLNIITVTLNMGKCRWFLDVLCPAEAGGEKNRQADILQNIRTRKDLRVFLVFRPASRETPDRFCHSFGNFLAHFELQTLLHRPSIQGVFQD